MSDNNNHKRKRKENNKEDTTEQQQEDKQDDNTLQIHPIVEYLENWKYKKSEWKFKVQNQRSLINQCLNAQIIDSKHFKIFLEYIAPMIGSDRPRLYNTCLTTIQQKRKQAQEKAMQQLKKINEKEIRNKCLENMKEILSESKQYKRAKIIIKVLRSTDVDSGSKQDVLSLPDLEDTDVEDNVEKKETSQEEEDIKEKKETKKEEKKEDSSDSSDDSSDEEEEEKKKKKTK
ncbi:hypothetical protein ABK040_003448 [Willaertia magna]